MATSIDQAFQKAYAKRIPKLGEPSSANKDTLAVWIDEPTGQRFRKDAAHDVAEPRMMMSNRKPTQAPDRVLVADAPETPETEAELESTLPEIQETAQVELPAQPEPKPEPVVSPAVSPAIDVRSGTTAYDAWSDKLRTLPVHPVSAPPPAITQDTSTSKPSSSASKPSESLRPVPKAFAPVWEVDEFLLPEIANELIHEHLQPIGPQLERASREGLQTLAITSQNRDTGRSTVAIAIAQGAAKAGLRVALVDADTENPSLIDQLQLEMSSDWVDAITAGISVEEAAVLSLTNKFCFIPLLPKTPEQLKNVDQCAATLFEQLSHHFDLIVVDFGPLHHASFGLSIPLSDELFDAVVLVEDMRRIDLETLESYARRIRAVGIENIGLIENFTKAA